MQRDKSIKYRCRKVWPILSWILCEACGKEFRYEYGYERELTVANIYLCCRCVKTREHADLVFDNWRPPMRRNIKTIKKAEAEKVLNKLTPTPHTDTEPLSG